MIAQSGRWRDNTRGWGLALRVAGAILPLAAFFVVYLRLEPEWAGAPVSGGAAGAFKVIAFLWAWPYEIFSRQPFSFGVLGLVCVILVVILVLRRDTRGWAAVLVWCFFWGWLLATIMGQGG